MADGSTMTVDRLERPFVFCENENPRLLCFGSACGEDWRCLILPLSPPDAPPKNRRIDGYKGIWFTLGQFQEFGDKYSGGLGTYTAKHHPLAVYSPKAKKTFFVYGGTTKKDERHLLAMLSYYDHVRNEIPKPIVVHDKITVIDPHDNPSINLDQEGHIWIFVSGRAQARPGFIYRSREPYDIESLELVNESEFTYPQPWWFTGKGFLLLFTKYTNGRELYWKTSRPDGTWSQDQKLAGMGGHYQMSNQRGDHVITAFNMHPGTVDRRTNLYFLQTTDRGETWRTADGTPIEPPLTDIQNPALIRDYQAEARLVYLKDINFDSEGRPLLLYVTSASFEPGPKGDPRIWTLAKWTGAEWRFIEITTSTHNYDMGSLYVEDDGTWRIIAPTEPGPQRHGTGGEM
ncbi:BNR-4 repeat-containing protein, partial [bacterium]|nr:BNR-4 repeat-containing protein [bacterium]